MKTCPNCNAKNEADDVFCKNCGTTLPPVTRQVIRQVSTDGTRPTDVEKRAASSKAGAKKTILGLPAAPAKASVSPEKPTEEAYRVPKKTKDRTMIGIPPPPTPPSSPGPVRLKRRGGKAKLPGTLVGMRGDDVEDIPIERPAEEKEKAAAAPQPVKPVAIKDTEAAPVDDDLAAAARVEHDKQADIDLIDHGDDVDIEILAGATIRGEEDLPGEDSELHEPETPAEKEKASAAEEEAPPAEEALSHTEEEDFSIEEETLPAKAKEEEKVTTEKPVAPPPETQPVEKKKKSKASYFISAIIILLVILAGLFYYQHVRLNKDIGEISTTREPKPAWVEMERQQKQGKISKWKVKLEGLPERANVYVDDVIHPEKPVILQETQEPRMFKIEASGFKTWEKAVSVQSDVTLPIDLKPLPAEQPAATAKGQPVQEVTEEPPATEKTLKKPEKKKKKKKKAKRKKKSVYDFEFNPYD